MLLFILFYILTCHISLASARADLTKDDFCFVACQQILRGVRFNGTNPTTGDPWPLCGNELEYKSLYLCNHLFCTDEERERGIEGVNKDCRNFSNATVLPYEIIERFTDEAIEKLNHLEAEDMSRMNPRTYNEVLVPSTKLYGLAWGTLVRIYIYLVSSLLTSFQGCCIFRGEDSYHIWLRYVLFLGYSYYHRIVYSLITILTTFYESKKTMASSTKRPLLRKFSCNESILSLHVVKKIHHRTSNLRFHSCTSKRVEYNTNTDSKSHDHSFHNNEHPSLLNQLSCFRE